MKRVLNILLYIIIFFLIVAIEILSIKKFFDMKKRDTLENIVASNYVATFVSFNEIKEEAPTIEAIDDEKNIEIIEEKENEVLKQDQILDDTKQEVQKEQDEIFIMEETQSDSVDILFDGLNEYELILKLEKNLKNELSGTGINFVEYYKKTGLDPYLSVAIVLHETGCTWRCSNLVNQCYNYGGMKGGEIKYKDTSYTCFTNKEEGINAYLDMLYNNYYAKGLTTAELINPKYASSLEWAIKINNYIDKIKNS